MFYREAGSCQNPTIVLFHGFPSASHMFRDLIPLLEDEYHLIAPDYPGFGQSDAPSRETFSYTFDHLAEVMDNLLNHLGLSQFFIRHLIARFDAAKLGKGTAVDYFR
ncbi:MAG: alpha/beta fold hydrolase [Acutalibacter sp.]|nr:alpha/beta fold hydrolase [Acutalibacter sp.]